MHHGVRPALNDVTWTERPWQSAQAYAESKLYDTVLAFAVARRWPDVLSNALEPGWVPTRMGGPGAPDDMDQAHRTQAWLATSADPAAQVTAGYFYHFRPRDPHHLSVAAALQSCGKGCSVWSRLAMRRRPRVNQDVMLRRTRLGCWSGRLRSAGVAWWRASHWPVETAR